VSFSLGTPGTGVDTLGMAFVDDKGIIFSQIITIEVQADMRGDLPGPVCLIR
jgi:uracil-DNA glycosylase